MQQCRQNASFSPAHTRALYQSQPQIRKQSTVNTPSLDPENFGKKLELQIDPNDPLPEWRLAKPAEPAPSSQPPTPTRRANIDLDESNPSSFPRSRHAPIPRYKHNPAITPGLFSFIKYRILRIPEPPNPRLSANQSFTILTNPYRARKSWPPILSHMSETEQFHYEKKFRRRLLNKTHSMRGTWDRWALFLRRFGVGFMLFWFGFVAEGEESTRLPSDGLRYWVYGKIRGVTSTGVFGNRLESWIEDNYVYYRRKHKRQWDPYNHDGWDESRPRNSLPGQSAPNVNGPLGDLSIVEEQA